MFYSVYYTGYGGYITSSSGTNGKDIRIGGVESARRHTSMHSAVTEANFIANNEDNSIEHNQLEIHKFDVVDKIPVLKNNS